jgi:hypothetical protein
MLPRPGAHGMETRKTNQPRVRWFSVPFAFGSPHVAMVGRRVSEKHDQVGILHSSAFPSSPA